MIFLEHSIGGENDILTRKLKKVSNIKEFNARRCGGISWNYSAECLKVGTWSFP